MTDKRWVSVLQDDLTELQLDIRNRYTYIETFRTRRIIPKLIHLPDLQYLLHDIKISWDLTLGKIYMQISRQVFGAITSFLNPSFCVDGYCICYLDHSISR